MSEMTATMLKRSAARFEAAKAVVVVTTEATIAQCLQPILLAAQIGFVTDHDPMLREAGRIGVARPSNHVERSAGCATSRTGRAQLSVAARKIEARE